MNTRGTNLFNLLIHGSQTTLNQFKEGKGSDNETRRSSIHHLKQLSTRRGLSKRFPNFSRSALKQTRSHRIQRRRPNQTWKVWRFSFSWSRKIHWKWRASSRSQSRWQPLGSTSNLFRPYWTSAASASAARPIGCPPLLDFRAQRWTMAFVQRL